MRKNWKWHENQKRFFFAHGIKGFSLLVGKEQLKLEQRNKNKFEQIKMFVHRMNFDWMIFLTLMMMSKELVLKSINLCDSFHRQVPATYRIRMPNAYTTIYKYLLAHREQQDGDCPPISSYAGRGIWSESTAATKCPTRSVHSNTIESYSGRKKH